MQLLQRRREARGSGKTVLAWIAAARIALPVGCQPAATDMQSSMPEQQQQQQDQVHQSQQLQEQQGLQQQSADANAATVRTDVL